MPCRGSTAAPRPTRGDGMMTQAFDRVVAAIGRRGIGADMRGRRCPQHRPAYESASIPAAPSLTSFLPPPARPCSWATSPPPPPTPQTRTPPPPPEFPTRPATGRPPPPPPQPP